MWNDIISKSSMSIEGTKKIPDGVRIVCLASEDFSCYEWHILIHVYDTWPGRGWTWEPISSEHAVKLGYGYQDDSKETDLMTAKEKALKAAKEYMSIVSHPISCYGNKSK